MNINFSGGKWFSLDIGSSAIRAVQLKNPSSKKPTLKHWGMISTSEASGFDPKKPNLVDDQIAQLTADMIRKSGITEKNVVLGIPSSKTFSTIVDMPAVGNKSEASQVIPVRAEDNIPMPIEEVDLDWQILGPSPIAQGQQEVLLAAVDKSYNQRRLSLVRSLGLKVVATEPEAFALPRSVIPEAEHDLNHIVIDIGNLETDLVVTIAGIPRLIRTIPNGASQIINRAAKELAVDPQQAQQIVTKFGLLGSKQDPKIQKAVVDGFQIIAEEVRKSIKFINGRYGAQAFQSILLTGAAQFVPGVEVYFENNFKVVSLVGNSWSNIDYPQALEQQLAQASSGFAVAVGLSRRTS